MRIEGCVIVHSLQEALHNCIEDEEIFIVGGADLYRQAIPLVDRMYITEIQQDVAGDAHFPGFDMTEWQEVARERRSQAEPQPFEYHFVTYQKALPSPQPSGGTTSQSTKPASWQVAGYPEGRGGNREQLE
jgi:dihydrofolate reductase